MLMYPFPSSILKHSPEGHNQMYYSWRSYLEVGELESLSCLNLYTIPAPLEQDQLEDRMTTFLVANKDGKARQRKICLQWTLKQRISSMYAWNANVSSKAQQQRFDSGAESITSHRNVSELLPNNREQPQNWTKLDYKIMKWQDYKTKPNQTIRHIKYHSCRPISSSF
jgi:hypothetical protein